ncbi:MAG: hypothetical protein ACM31H_01880 [Nitrososphaerales archaeon]
MTNNKIVLATITMIVAAGLLALSPSSMIGNAQAQMYDNQYGYDNNYYQDDNSYYQDDNRYSYDKKDQKSSYTDIQKINCGNSNVNVNGVDVTEIPRDNTALGAANEGGPQAANTENGNGFADRINFDRNLVNVCVNANGNEQTRVIGETQPPVTLFTCDADSNLGADARVTDLQLCDAATPAEQCGPDTDLEGVWVFPPATEEVCNIETEPVTVTAITYENAGTTDTTSPFSSTATCDMGDVATGGGFTKTGTLSAVDSSHKTATGEGWLVTGSAVGTASFTAFVECLTNLLTP